MAKTLLFDFDGTIADSFDMVADVFFQLMGREPITNQAEIHRMRQLPVIRVVKELRVSPIQIPRLLMRGRKMMSSRMHDIKMFNGMHEALDQLHEAGYTLYIMSSNSTQNVRSFLSFHKVDTYFTEIHGGIGLFNKAGAIRKVLRRNGLRAEDCIYIGDEVRDIDGARKAGVHIVSVAWGYNDSEILKRNHPDAVVASPKDLSSVIRKV